MKKSMTMRFAAVALLASSALVFSNCSSDDDATTATNANSLALQNIDTAMASIASISASSSDDIGTYGGVASTYCNVNSGPAIGGSDVATTANEFASLTGFCQATHNAQSPDSVRGAMYISGALSCIAGRAGLFDGLTTGSPKTTTTDITIDTNCFGTQAMVDAMVADMGSSTISSVALSVEQLESSHPYDFRLIFTLPSQPAATAYIKNSDGIKAAMFDDGGGPWAIKMDSSTASNTTVHYEGINTTNYRRMRILITGALNSSGEFSSVSSISGFWMQGSSGSYSNFVTFTGNLTVGIIGNSYPSGGPDVLNQCYHPGGSGTCSGLTSISSSQANGASQHSALSASGTALTSGTTLLTVPATIDPADTDLYN